MTSVQEFIEVRMSIETLADKITLFVDDGAIQDSRKHLDSANQQLEVLKTMVANDVQMRATDRLSRQLIGLGVQVETMKAKTPVRKTAAKKKA
jgi:hypothetical protein